LIILENPTGEGKASDTRTAGLEELNFSRHYSVLWERCAVSFGTDEGRREISNRCVVVAVVFSKSFCLLSLFFFVLL